MTSRMPLAIYAVELCIELVSVNRGVLASGLKIPGRPVPLQILLHVLSVPGSVSALLPARKTPGRKPSGLCRLSGLRLLRLGLLRLPDSVLPAVRPPDWLLGDYKTRTPSTTGSDLSAPNGRFKASFLWPPGTGASAFPADVLLRQRPAWAAFCLLPFAE